MSTTSANPNPSFNPKPKPDKSRQQVIAISAVIIVLLLALNAFLLISHNKRGKVNEQLSTQLDESEQLKAELEQQYYEALSELDEMQGTNEEMNALIEQQKSDLTEQRDKIERLLRDNRNLKAARKELTDLRSKTEQYLAELNQLRQENELLNTENTDLKTTNQSLQTNLDAERMTTQELSSAKAALVSEKQNLEADNERLNLAASSLKAINIQAEGQKTRRSGKSVSKSFAKNVEQIQVCFDAEVNSLAEVGTETFHLRIMNPLGETISVEALGSGQFKNMASGQMMLYTLAESYPYEREQERVCMIWKQDIAFQAGPYDIELYNKGYLSGRTTLQLK